MRINYNVTGDARKALVKVIADTTGAKAQYMRTPTYAYQIDYFTVTREGALEFSDRSDTEEVEAVLEALAAAGFEGIGEGSEAPEEAQDTPTVAGTETAEADGLVISLPMEGHTGASLRNLVSMIYSRGRLISKATGGAFACSGALVYALKDDACILTTDTLRKTVTDFEAEHGPTLVGISFEGGKVSFTGFPFNEDPDSVKAFTQLVGQMNRLAKEQKRTLAREVDDSNERYIFRIWLLRLGMAGDEFKTARKVLLSPLSGSAAFKDSAMEERWKANQTAKRDAARAARKTESAEITTVSEPDTKEADDETVSA